MWSNPSHFLQSSSFRLTLIYTGVFALGSILLLFVIGMSASFVIRLEVDRTVDQRIEALLGTFERDGLDGVQRAIQDLLDGDDDDELSYQLRSGDGTLLAGNLDVVGFGPGWFEFVPPDKDDDEAHFAHAVQLPDNSWLVVAIDGEAWHDARELIVEGSLWTLIITVPMALVCGLLMASMVLRRIEAITRTTARIRAGGLDSRVAVRGNGDEFDRLADHINAMLDSIQDLTKEIESVSVGVAHDLRTPLSRLRNRLEMVRQNGVDRAKLDGLVDGALGEVESLIGTFDALTRIAQIDAGTRRAGFKTVDLSAIVRELAETYEPVANATGKRLEVDLDDGLTVEADRALIIQMVVNILENAIEHAPPQTTITMRLHANGTGPEITIADNGPGIPAHEHENVFKRFYRLDRSRGTQGSGLGLSMVQSIARLHGIDVRIRDNQPGLTVAFAFST